MELRVLGPVELFAGGRSVRIGAAKQRALLALLVVERGQPVSREWLIEQLWQGRPPAAAKGTLQSCVYRLRKLFESLDAPIQLHTRAGGYLLEIPPGLLDLDAFEQATATGLGELSAGRPESAVSGLRSALGLWRAQAFDGIDLPLVREYSDRLRERRLDATELCLSAELAAGRHATVVGELEDLTAAHPLRESLWRLRMLALARSGRGPEALKVYDRLCRLLDEELGVGPSAPVRELYQQILAGDQVAAPPPAAASRAAPAAAGRVPPRMLPAAVGDLAGRKAQLARLDELLTPVGAGAGAGARQPEAVVISAISGTAGIGKTMLAVHWAHRVAGRFPDGQLYVNLRGFGPTADPMPPREALRGFLDALGVQAGQIPAEFDAQVGLYRSLLAHRRVLVVLDNAKDSEQVRPLLPGAPGCLVVVTSRNQLTGLVGAQAAHPVLLDVLTTEEARELLARRLGPRRTDAEPHAVHTLITTCARLPLALAIVAARAAAHPDVPLQTLADELSQATSSLDAFTDTAGTDVRAVFSWSYRQLTPHAARLFRLLGLHPGPDVSTPAAASLAGTSPTAVRPLLTELAHHHLLTQHQPNRYTSHDLLRAYARELAVGERAGVDDALERMLDHYVHAAYAADRVLNPRREDPISLSPPRQDTFLESFASTQHAVDWFATERPVLLAAIALAGDSGFHTHAWQLSWAMVDYLDRYGHWRAWITAENVALHAAERNADRPGQARAHDRLVRPYVRLERLPDARHHAEQALLAYTEIGDRAGQANAQQKLGWVLGVMEHTSEALEHMRQALTLYRRVGNRTGEVDALAGLGWLYTVLGEYQQAVAYCRESVELCHEVGHHAYGWASSWEHLGRVLYLTGEHQEAADCYRRALALYVDIGDRHNQALRLTDLADAELAAGEHTAAEEHLRRALAMFEELGSREAEAVRARLAPLSER